MHSIFYSLTRMKMKNVILYIFFYSLVFSDDNVIVFKPNISFGSDFLDQNDADTIHSLFTDGLSLYFKNITISEKVCSEKACALKSSNGANIIIFYKLQKLGSNLIFSSTRLNLEDSFSAKVTAKSIEDMEQVCLRISKSIALQESVDSSADVDNITEVDSDEISRRTSLGRIGLSGGIFIPFSDYEYTENSHFGSHETTKYSNLVKLNYSYLSEFKNNTALLIEGGFASPRVSFMDLNFIKFDNKEDTSPFYGAGVGYFSLPRDSGYSPNDSGPALSLQAGLVLYRTYNLNVMLRSKFIQVFNDSKDKGLIFDVGVHWKIKSPNYKQSNYPKVINRYPILDIILNRN